MVNPAPDNPLGIVVSKAKAGLGNRILATTTAMLFAELTGRRLYVDWRDFAYSNDGTNSYPRLFEPRQHDESIAATLESEAPVNPAIWSGRLGQSANDLIDAMDADRHGDPRIWRKYSFDLSRIDHPERVLVMWAFNHQTKLIRKHFHDRLPELAGKTDGNILRKVLAKEFRLAKPLQDSVDAFVDSRFRRPVIGVHVRFMDRRSRIESFFHHTDKIRRSMPDAQVFLATDNRDVEAKFAERYGDVLSTPKWFPSAGVSMHQNTQCPDRFQNAVEALTDMFLLARCDWLVFPGSSTFSLLSSMIGTFEPGRVVDIERFNLRIRAKRALRSYFT